jgi:hypothetical protein
MLSGDPVTGDDAATRSGGEDDHDDRGRSSRDG